MTREEFTLRAFDVQRVESQLTHIEQGATAVLTAMRCPTNPVQIFAILKDERIAPWPKRTSERSKRRARYALHVILQIGNIRQHLGLVHPNAPLAADAALTLGWLTSQLGLDLFTNARATQAGSAPKKKTQRRSAKRNAKLRRDAAKLPSKLSISAKAKLLARTSKLTADRIRHIIG